jgi:general secretion pathway protein D
MENAERKKMEYYKNAYDHMRAKMLSQVDEAWEDKVPVQGAAVTFDYGIGRSPGAYLTEKMNKIIFPTVQFQGATIDEAIEYLRVKSRDLDTFTDASGVKGVNIILRTGDAPSNASISLDLKDVPMSEALRYITELAQMKYKVEAHAVLVVPLSEDANQQYTRSYRVPPDFLSAGGGDAGGGAAPAAPADPFAAGGAAAGGSNLITKKTAKQILEAQGITFPEGSSASFNPATSQLMVRNTQPNLDVVEAFVESLINQGPKMVVITSKFVEVTQKNTEELGFDWLLGGVGMNGNNVFAGGGATGNGNAFNAANFPFQGTNTIPGVFSNTGQLIFPAQSISSALGGPLPSGLPQGTIANAGGSGPVTSGLRSGSLALNNNSIDNLLSTGATTTAANVAPGIFSAAGVFTDPQFQVVMRGLSQKKGVDLMSAPSVTTKSGTRATMEVTREFIYPTEFDPPQLPQGGGGNVTLGGGGGTQIATPTTPTAFEMRRTGVILEAEPTVGADGNTIELTLAPEVTEFDGFINYGSPIFSPSSSSFSPVTTVITNLLPGPPPLAVTTTQQGFIPLSQPEQLITPNTINQPVFSVRKVSTGVSIWDGQTVALGGLIREDVQDVEDKLPILGDLPFIGRLFRSESELHFKRNLMIFVTAHLIDPSGQRVKNNQPAAPAIGGTVPGNPLLPAVAP